MLWALCQVLSLMCLLESSEQSYEVQVSLFQFYSWGNGGLRRHSGLPRVGELGFMLVICTKPCWTPKPGVAFLPRWYHVHPVPLGSPVDSLCADGPAWLGLRCKQESGENSREQLQTLVIAHKDVPGLHSELEGVCERISFPFPCSPERSHLSSVRGQKIHVLGLFLLHIM